MEIRNPSTKPKGVNHLANGIKKPRGASLSNGGSPNGASGSSDLSDFGSTSGDGSTALNAEIAKASVEGGGERLQHATFSHVAKSSSVIIKHPHGLGSDAALEDEKRTFADRLGIWLSFLCMIHCLATPVLLLAFPALQAMEVSQFHESFHMALLLILPIVAVVAFIPGYRRHRSREVFYWALPGLAIIAYVALWFDDGSWLATAVSVTGSLFLIRAHSVNRRLCACCHPPARAR